MFGMSKTYGREARWHWLLPPGNQITGMNTQNSQLSVILTDPLLLQWVSRSSSLLSHFSHNLTALSWDLKLAEWLIFLKVSYIFTTVRLWLTVSQGLFSLAEGKVLWEKWRRQKWKRLWLKILSSPASPRGRTELTTCNENVDQIHGTLGVSQILKGSLQFLCWWPGDIRADLLQKSNLIAQGKSAFPHFHLFLSFPQNYS